MKVLNYAKQCCDTIMRQYKAGELPPFPHFHYHAGVFLSGMERYYLLSGEEKYNDYIKEYLDTYVDSEGELHHVDKETLDDLQPCTLLYRYVNDEPRYRKVLDDYVPLLINWKVNPLGGFWHKGIHPNQMWLDSLYMAGPLGIKYGILTKQRKYIEIIHTQLELMWKHMRDEKTGLLYHAWDYGKKAVWADSVSGCSSQFWGRALGWYVVSSADMSEYLDRKSVV